MPRWARQMWVDALPELIASQQLRAIEAASFPKLTQDSQHAISERYTKALPEESQAKPQAPRDKLEYQALAAAAGFGIVFEPKEKKAEVSDA